MKCNNCGYENPQGTGFCANCGSKLPDEQYNANAYTAPAAQPDIYVSQTAVNPVSNHIFAVLKDKLFLAICILMSASAGLSLLTGNLSVIDILITVFLWLVYAQSTKNIVDAKQMRCVSGALYASYILYWVMFGIMAAAMVTLTIAIAFIGSNIGAFSDIAPSIVYGEEYYGFFEILSSLSAGWIIAILLIITVIVLAVILVFCFYSRDIHRFVKSVYKSVEMGNFCFVKCGAVGNWLMVIGIINGLSAVSNISSSVSAFLSGGALAAAEIIGSVLVKKYFHNFK